MLGTRTPLGLAIDELGIVAAEVHLRSGRPEIRRAGELAFTEKLNSDNAAQLGQQLRQFLHKNHFSSKQAVVGIPTNWIVTKEVVIPPVASDALADMLDIQAERAFSLNASELVFDYCGQTSASEKSRLLLLAARRETVGRIKEMMAAAGLRVRAMTVSALAFGRAVSEAGPKHIYGLYARPTYCEFWSQLDGRVRSVKHLPIAAKNGTAQEHAELLTSTIQQLVLLSSQQDQSPPYEVAAYDACGLSAETIAQLNERLTPQITVTDGRARLLAREPGSAAGREEAGSIAAVALAMTTIGADGPRVDFLNPRIGAKKTSARKRVTIWAAAVGAVCLVGLGAVLADWHRDRADVAVYTQQLEGMSEDIAAAREVVDRISQAGAWFSQEPKFLDCLRELTLAFPEEPRIWATSLALSENAEGMLIGKATDEESFYEVLDTIKQNAMFSAVKMMYIRDVGRGSSEKEFAVTFIFEGLK